MRVVEITRRGSPDVLKVREVTEPVPAPGEILVAVKAAGVNFADLLARMGLYPDAPKLPCVVGYEVAGTVIKLGEEVQGIEVGDRVMAGTRFGGYAEKVVVPAQDVVALPARLSFEQGAAVPVNYGTAWAALIRYGSLHSGERVLIHAAAGGVGIAATQIAKRYGAEVYGTASPSKHEAVRAFGVDHPVDYTRKGWDKALPKFDLIMDAIGGRSFRTSYRLLRPGGRLICFGISAAVSGERRSTVGALKTVIGTPRFNLLKQMSDSKAVIGLNMLRLWEDRETLAPWITPVVDLIEDGTVQPVVAEAFPFEHAAEAHRMLAQRRNIGKVVLTT